MSDQPQLPEAVKPLRWDQKLVAAPGLPIEYWYLSEEELVAKLKPKPAGEE